MPDSNDAQSNANAENSKRQIQLKFVDRLSSVPCVETTINKTTEIYEKVKVCLLNMFSTTIHIL